ncbi:MAG TPA: TonB-dependent receptor [Gammaproteobacteria bacterium]
MAVTAVSSSAYGQEPQSLEEIVVTGSRIVRQDFQSNSPIVTVDNDDFETQTGLNIESYLNQMPQYNPAASPVTTEQDVQITPINSVGVATISLRGFGPNRSLTLVNGKRQVPINALMWTDINSIPSALIERVETITGGASAVYGADAIGGVTNFILRDDFEGFEVDMQYGATSAGDGDESRISAVFGSNFDDGRGNIALGVESYNRDAAYEINHDPYVEYRSNPRSPGSFLFLQGINGYNCNTRIENPADPDGPTIANCPDFGTVNALFSDTSEGRPIFLPFGYGNFQTQFAFNPDGTIFANTGAGGLSRYRGPVDGREYVRTIALDGSTFLDPGDTYEGLKWNNMRAFASAPQERQSFFASGTYDLNDRVSLFARSTFAQSKTQTVLFGTSVIAGWEGTIPYNPTTDSPVDPSLDYTDPDVVTAVRDNPDAFANPDFIATGEPGAQHPVPVELAILLNSRIDPTGRWQPDWNPDDSLPPRSTFNTNEVWQIEMGANFDLGADWTGEAYYGRGESSTYNVAAGNLSLERYRALIEQPDYGRGAKISGNENSIRPNFGAADITCTSGFYDTFFSGDAPLSQDCFDAINATLQTRTQNTQDIIELNFQGPVAELPAGDVRLAAGYQKRRNSSVFNPDILQSTVSFTDQVVGVYPTGYLDASTSVDDYYLEALVPVIQDKPAFQRLELELGWRTSDYEHTDKEDTWKSLLNWQVNDRLRFRGGFNRATRAPNLGELFLNSQEVFTAGGNFGDPCGIRSNSPFGMRGLLGDPNQEPDETDPRDLGLAPGQTEAGAQSTYLICQELMGGAGSTGAVEFYDRSDATGESGDIFAWVLQEGNPNLKSETADTWTFGLVADVGNVTLTADWYKVEIEDAIMLYSIDYANFLCFGTNIVSTPEEAAAQAATRPCQLLPRDQNNGAPLTTSLSFDNQATIETSGMDLAVNWTRPLFAGTLGLNMQATILDYYRTKQSPAPFDPEIDWAGSLGPNLSGTDGGAYDYRLFGSLNYSMRDWTVNLRMRYLPPVWTADYAAQQAIIENNQRVAAGGEGILLGYTPSSEIETDAYSIFDLSFNWNLTESMSLRGGITNLFDTDPELVGADAGYPPGTDLGAVCNGAPGCIPPTTSLSNPGTIDAGYYDTLGRRYFLGLAVRF